MNNLNTSILKGLPLLVPPIQQQKDIVEHNGQRITTIEECISKSDEEIFLISQFHTRLIADVVTGKLDVREAAAHYPRVDPLVVENNLGESLRRDSEADPKELDPAFA